MADALNRLLNHIEPIGTLIKPVMLAYLPYNLSGYKMCMSTY
jgi:hypothetical protein